jgi:LPXTG-motif cell wall-anchored protein
MHGVIPVTAAPCDESDIPPLWSALQRYDATRGYEHALARLLRAIGLVGSSVQAAIPVRPSVISPPASQSISASQPAATVRVPGPQSYAAPGYAVARQGAQTKLLKAVMFAIVLGGGIGVVTMASLLMVGALGLFGQGNEIVVGALLFNLVCLPLAGYAIARRFGRVLPAVLVGLIAGILAGSGYLIYGAQGVVYLNDQCHANYASGSSALSNCLYPGLFLPHTGHNSLYFAIGAIALAALAGFFARGVTRLETR